MLELDTPYVRAMAAYSERSCTGGVVLWSVPTPQNGQPATETTVQLNLKRLPLSEFMVEAYIIDDRRFPTVSSQGIQRHLSQSGNDCSYPLGTTGHCKAQHFRLL